ncbi:XRE family transcriptional regulator [Kribbella sancticallisti]
MTISGTVGSNLRHRRQERQMSLADLAAAAGIGKTTLHALELGEGNPTLSTLWALAAALEVPLGALLEDEPEPVTVVRAEEGPWVDGDSVHARLLHRLNVRGSVEVYELEVDQARQLSEAHLPGVQECLVVTRGRVKAGPADAPVDLGAGDSIHHQAAQPHLYEGLDGDNQALLLMIYNS